MRAKDSAHVGALLLLASCSLNIGHEQDALTTIATLPALSGCLPLSDQVQALSGSVSTLTLPDGRALVLADAATASGETSSAAFSDASGPCLSGGNALAARPIIDCSRLAAGVHCRPLGSVHTTARDVFLYFSADHAGDLASDGRGIAHWDDSAQRFIADALLWTGDRPDYGSAAALVGDNVYVFGALGARYLAADVYLARVPRARITEASAYEYWQGGGGFGSDPDSARPLVEGGLSPSVAFDADHQRWLMLYATPLADTVTVRTGLGVTGPWSAPHPLGHCDLPASDPSAFCANLTLVPTLAESGELAFTQGVASFSRPERATAEDFWTRLVRAPWRSELP